jgi:hypothetical protein
MTDFTGPAIAVGYTLGGGLSWLGPDGRIIANHAVSLGEV